MKFILFIILSSFPFLFSAKLKPEIDYTIFYNNNDSIEIEIYYEFKSENLNYIKLENINVCNIVFEAEITSVLDRENFVWELNSSEIDLSQNRLIFGTKSILLPNSQYNLKIKYFQDINPSEFEVYEAKIIPKRKSEMFLSDIYFASIINQKDSTKIKWDKSFLKNDKYVIPNASKQYFSTYGEVLFYHEVYNSKKSCLKHYRIEYKILDAVKKVQRVITKKSFELSDNAISEIQSIPVPELATGVYFLDISIYKDEDETPLDKVTHKFFYMNFEKAPELIAKFTENELFERSEFITMDEETIQREFDKLKFVMSNQDLDIWENLTELKGKQRALFTYWRNKDPDSTTYYNEAKEEFDRAVRYANTYYQFAPSIEGWRTDRGRVLLKYGFPMVVESFPRNGEQIPCEIWYYGEAGGGAYFYFVDRGGFNNFILVHSTVFGENQNEYWIEEFNPAVNFEHNVKRSDHYFK